MSSKKSHSQLNVKFLSLNLFLRPPFIHTNESDYKDARLQYFIQNIIQEYDIICLQETYSAYTLRQNRLIEEAETKQFLYSAVSPKPKFWSTQFVDCGLVILSKYRIVEVEFLPFTYSLLPDKLSYKGSLYAKILINGKYIHVFTSHLQSKHPTEDSAQYLAYRLVRRSQLIELRNYIDTKIGNTNEAAIIAGDLNIDGREELKPPAFPDIECKDDYENFINILSKHGKAALVDILRKKYGHSPATFGRGDENGNPLEKVLTAPDQTLWDESLDYILMINENTSGVTINWSDTHVEPFYISGQPFTQISDHAGVQTSFRC
ncbi:unnamed protein product [Blepharisma stoltei]|uniref:sphingomyelin phosphodiesterase n=1 Tax=Blepharisma stoltei TaxID=1481888 RepID=A0AAU9KFN3_9CILI|nr:unnamed protein product [Blepharisma stoltei]